MDNFPLYKEKKTVITGGRKLMINLHEELYYEPAEILEQFDGMRAEMSKRELAFLCGLIKKYRPEKIVEIGVASGGTTGVILQCIAMLDYNAKVFSLDLSEDYYREPSKKTGYLIDECKKLLTRKVDHTLITGKYAVESLETIGKGIDFLILDTVHKLPGELLDFLACYKFLNSGSVVVLHDLILNHTIKNLNSFATKVLFDTVTAEKILDLDDETNFPNIGAYIVNEDTGKYINDIFSALTISWRYRPGDRELMLYRDFYKKYYSCDNLKLFDMALELNSETLHKRVVAKNNEFLVVYKLMTKLRDKNVYIYGCGNYGRQFYHMLDRCGINLKGYIISDGEEKVEVENGERIFYLSEVNLDKENDVIYLGVNTELCSEIAAKLNKMRIEEYIIPDSAMYEYIVK